MENVVILVELEKQEQLVKLDHKDPQDHSVTEVLQVQLVRLENLVQQDQKVHQVPLVLVDLEVLPVRQELSDLMVLKDQQV